MSTASKTPSQKEAENFHVLPKKDTAREQGKTPATVHDRTNAPVVDGTDSVVPTGPGARDAEAGSQVDGQTNQPIPADQARRDIPANDRTRVS